MVVVLLTLDGLGDIYMWRRKGCCCEVERYGTIRDDGMLDFTVIVLSAAAATACSSHTFLELQGGLMLGIVSWSKRCFSWTIAFVWNGKVSKTARQVKLL